MSKLTNEQRQAALAAVNAAVNPHGFRAEFMDDIDDGEEVWFTLWYIDESKQKEVKQGYFEAVYYTVPKYGKEAGYIAYGIMDGEWSDLPPNVAAACEIFGKWSRQETLEQMIAAYK